MTRNRSGVTIEIMTLFVTLMPITITIIAPVHSRKDVLTFVKRKIATSQLTNMKKKLLNHINNSFYPPPVGEGGF